MKIVIGLPLPEKSAPDGMRCYVCNALAPVGEPGWERQRAERTAAHGFVEGRDLCPKHRQSRPKALTTLGEMIAAKAAR